MTDDSTSTSEQTPDQPEPRTTEQIPDQPGQTPSDPAPSEPRTTTTTPAAGRRAPRERIKADARRVGAETKRVGRETGRSLGKFDYRRPRVPDSAEAEQPNANYPHDTHPILVPGIAIDEQRRHYWLDRVIFAIAGSLTVAFVIWGISSPSSVAEVAQTAYDWATLNVGWFFNLVAIIVLVALLILAFSPYGKIQIGRAHV